MSDESAPSAPSPAPSATQSWSTGPAIEMDASVDVANHIFNDKFKAPPAISSQAAESIFQDANMQAAEQKQVERLVLQSISFPAMSVATCLESSAATGNLNRKEMLAASMGLTKPFFTLDMVNYTNPGDKKLFRPGRVAANGDLIRRDWKSPGEGGQLVEGSAGGNRLLFLEQCWLNGAAILLNSWLYFITAAVQSLSKGDSLKHSDTTVWLGRVLRIILSVVKSRHYLHFVLSYRSKRGNIRVITAGKDWIHSVVPLQFQALLNGDSKAVLPFTVDDPGC
eukprot:g14194.t1